MSNFTLRFQPVPGRALAHDNYDGSLVWMPEWQCFRVGRLLKNGLPLPLLDDMPQEVRDYLCVETREQTPIIALGLETNTIEFHTEQIRKLLPKARRATMKNGTELLQIQFRLSPWKSGEWNLRFDSEDDVVLTQPGEIAPWGLASQSTVIPCQTQLQAERLAQQLWVKDGDLYHRDPEIVEDEDTEKHYFSSTNPLEHSTWSIVVGTEESEFTATYAIDYQFIRSDQKGDYDFVVLHAAQDHDYSSDISYCILPFDEWESAALDLVQEVSDLAFGHDAEEWYVELISQKEYDNNLAEMIDAMKADIKEEMQ